MKTLVFEHEKSLREILTEFTILLTKYLKKSLLIFLHGLWRTFTVLVYAFFVPAKLYKVEGVEGIPQEVTVREEYQKFIIPRGPFC